MLSRSLLNNHHGGWGGPNKVRAIACAMTLLVIAAVFGGVSWQWSGANELTAVQSEHAAESAASFIASQCDLLLRDGDAAGVRRLMIDIQSAGVAAACRVELDGLGVIASTDPSEIGIMSLPETWAPALASPESAGGDGVVRSVFDVPGKGGGTVTATYTAIPAHASEMLMRGGVIAGFALLAISIAYTRARRYLGVWSNVSSALRAVGDGERRADVLRLGDCFGDTADAWNTMLEERDALDARLCEQIASESVGAHAVDAAFLPAACDSMAQGLVVINALGESVYANGAASVLLGIAKEDALSGGIDTIFSDEGVRATIREAISGASSVRKTAEIARGENAAEPEAELRVSVRTAECGSDRVAAVIIEDITQQRLSDRSRNAFVAQATHELRTPLTNIRLYVEQAIDEEDDAALRTQAINVIGSESRRLERIVSDMLSVSEIEAGSLSIRPSSVRTDALFEELTKDYGPQAKEKSIELKFDLPPKFPVINADRDRLGQALHNLIGNAIKYTPSGGQVTVKVDIPSTGGMQVSVVDTGIGIDPDECDRIFERFYRADDRRIAHVTGSGLGLALAQEIARLHGGEITVKSQINEGSTFTLSIPGEGESEQSGKRAA